MLSLWTWPIGDTVSRMVPPIVVNGVSYRVLRLDGKNGMIRFLLRNEAGELFGVYGRNAQAALSAAPLSLKLAPENPFRGVDLFEGEDGRLIARS